jgi:hypothetical protein
VNLAGGTEKTVDADKYMAGDKIKYSLRDVGDVWGVKVKLSCGA